METETTEITIKPNGHLVTTREEFGASQVQTQHETAATAVAARESAAVQARYIVAERRPRDVEQFRVRLEATCRRPGFAEKVEYAKPLGQKWNPKTSQMEDQFAYGPTIRFIEAALQLYGNVYPEVTTVFDSTYVRICRVSVSDLETNITYTTEVQITKQVERKGKTDKKTKVSTPPAGRIVISERLNSYGETTYTVIATDDEVLVKQNALLSKSLRTNAQRLLPWDIVERCMEIARRTLANQDAEDPEAAKRSLIDNFAKLGVEPVDLEAFLGKSLNKPLVPAELAILRKNYVAIHNGESTWEEMIENKASTGSEEQQKELLARKLAEAEAALKQDTPTTDKTGGTEKKQDAVSGETGQIATDPGTSSEPPPASTSGSEQKQRLQFGSRKQ